MRESGRVHSTRGVSSFNDFTLHSDTVSGQLALM